MQKIILSLFLVCSLAACSSDSWFGEQDYSKVAGKRISILEHETTIKPDVMASDLNILLPKPEMNKSWPQAGGLSHHAMGHMFAKSNLKRVWKHNIGEGSSDRDSLLSEPIIAEGLVFAIDAEAKITAYEVQSGYKAWEKDLTPEDEENVSMRGGGLAYDNGLVFVTTGFGKVFALSAKKGELIWEKEILAPVRSAPTINGNRIFIITLDNKVIALRANDGKELWKHTALAKSTSILGRPSVAVDYGVVVAPFSSGELKALRVDSGSQLWADILTSIKRTDSIADLADIRAPVVMDRGIVYAIGHNDLMVAIDLRTGRRLWEKEIGGTHQPWLAGRYIFVLTNDKSIVSLEAKTGKILWVRPLERYEDEADKKGAINWTGPVLVSNRLIVAGSHGKALAISPYTGKIIGYEKLPDGVSSVMPTVAEETVFFLTDEGDLVAYR